MAGLPLSGPRPVAQISPGLCPHRRQASALSRNAPSGQRPQGLRVAQSGEQVGHLCGLQLEYQRSRAQRRIARVEAGKVGDTATFMIRVPFLQLGFGDVVKLVGEQPTFGAWSVSAAPALAWTEDHHWVGTFELAPETYQFKVVIVRQGGNHQWENGEDRLLQVTPDFNDREVVCTFNHTAEMPMSASPEPKAAPQRAPEDTTKAEAVLEEIQASQPALADVKPEQLESMSAQDLGSAPEQAEVEAEKLELTQAVAAAAGFADEAPRQPPGEDELEAASAFVTGEATASENGAGPALHSAAQPQEAVPAPEAESEGADSKPEPPAAEQPAPEPAPEPAPVVLASAVEESSLRIEGTPVSVAFDGTMTFSFDEGDSTDDAATLAAKLIPDLPDVASMGYLGNGKTASDPTEAAAFAASFAEPSVKAAALPQVAFPKLRQERPSLCKWGRVAGRRR